MKTTVAFVLGGQRQHGQLSGYSDTNWACRLGWVQIVPGLRSFSTHCRKLKLKWSGLDQRRQNGSSARVIRQND